MSACQGTATQQTTMSSSDAPSEAGSPSQPTVVPETATEPRAPSPPSISPSSDFPEEEPESASEGALAVDLPADAPALVARAGTTSDPPNLRSGAPLPIAFISDVASFSMTSAEQGADDEQRVLSVSPDNTKGLTFHEATAVSNARYEILDLASDQQLSDFELGQGERTTTSSAWWSPDSQAVHLRTAGPDGVAAYLHRVGGATARLVPDRSRGISFASGPEATKLVTCEGQLAFLTATVEAGEGVVQTDGSTCRTYGQLRDAVGRPTALYTMDEDDGFGVYEVGFDGEVRRIERGDIEVSDRGLSVGECNAVGVLGFDGTGDTTSAVFVPGTRSLIGVPELGSCPVLSPDRHRLAFVVGSGAVRVLDTSSGEIVDVATSGFPVAFGSSGEQLLVDGGGTFVVASDGSMGEEASVQVVRRGAAYCALGDTGLALLQEQDGVAVFDIDASEVVTRQDVPLGQGCAVSPDGRWAVNGRILVDIEVRDSWTLPAIDVRTGHVLPPPDFALQTEYDLAGPAWRAASLSSGG